MKKRKPFTNNLLSFLAGVSLLLIACTAESAPVDDSGLSGKGDIGKPMGKMDGFWRYWACSGALQYLKQGGPQMRIESFNEFYKGSSFPYHRADCDYEQPFCDGAWIGGAMGNEWDSKNWVLKRAGDGSLYIDKEMLRRKLDLFFKDMDLSGETMTLVLHIETALCSKPEKGALSLKTPPDDPKQWGWAVEEYCKALVELYGEKRMQNLSFRIGTEWIGENRFSGTTKQLYDVYDYATAGILKVIPTAKIGPYNEGSALDENPKRFNHFTIARHCATEVNAATGKVGTPFDIQSASLFLLNGAIIGGWYPEREGTTFRKNWGDHKDRFPEVLGKARREIHEYGFWGGDELVDNDQWGADGAVDTKKKKGEGHEELGARGGVFYLGTILSLRAFADLSRFYIYNTFEPFNDEVMKYRVLPWPMAWVINIFDAMRNYDAYALDLTRYRHNYWQDKIPFQKMIDNGVEDFTGMVAFSPERSILMLYAWQANRQRHDEREIEINIPVAALPSQLGTVSYVQLDDGNNVMNVVRNTFKENNILRQRFIEHPDLIDQAKVMYKSDTHKPSIYNNNKEIGRVVLQDYDKYVAVSRESLTLKPFAGRGTVAKVGDKWNFKLKMTPPMVIAIVIDHGKPAAPNDFKVETEGLARAVFLGWKDAAANETGFVIEKESNGQKTQPIKIDANQQSFTDYDVQYGQKYVYRIKALGAAGDSDWSANQSITLAANTGIKSIIEADFITMSPEWKKYSFRQSYQNPVLVCATNFANQADPTIVEVRNVTSSGFEAQLHVVAGKPMKNADRGYYVVVEEGDWILDGGLKVMARKISVNAELRQQLKFPDLIKDPVVVGQVMTRNNSGWSNFLMTGIKGNTWSEPNRNNWFVGLNIGSQKKDVFSANETLGVIAFEKGRGSCNGIEYEFGQTAPAVSGVASVNNPPYSHKIQEFRRTPSIALVSAAQTGNNSMLYWPVLYSNVPFSKREIRVALDHDTHRMISSPAAVSYVLFGQPFSISKK